MFKKFFILLLLVIGIFLYFHKDILEKLNDSIKLSKISVTSFYETSFKEDRVYRKLFMLLLDRSNLEKLLNNKDMEILDHKWTKFEIEKPNLLDPLGYKLYAIRKVKAKINSEYIKDTIDLSQIINIGLGNINIEIKLDNKSGYINQHDTKISMTREGLSSADIKIQNTIEYQRDIPQSFKDYMQSEVDKYNISFVNNTKKSIQEILD